MRKGFLILLVLLAALLLAACANDATDVLPTQASYPTVTPSPSAAALTEATSTPANRPFSPPTLPPPATATDDDKISETDDLPPFLVADSVTNTPTEDLPFARNTPASNADTRAQSGVRAGSAPQNDLPPFVAAQTQSATTNDNQASNQPDALTPVATPTPEALNMADVPGVPAATEQTPDSPATSVPQASPTPNLPPFRQTDNDEAQTQPQQDDDLPPFAQTGSGDNGSPASSEGAPFGGPGQPQATMTPSPVPTATREPTPQVVDGMAVIEMEQVQYYLASAANVRPCPRIDDDCEPLTTLSGGMPIIVNGRVDGEAYNGGRVWFRVVYNGRPAFIHGSLLTDLEPTQPANTVIIQYTPTPVPNFGPPGQGAATPGGQGGGNLPPGFPTDDASGGGNLPPGFPTDDASGGNNFPPGS